MMFSIHGAEEIGGGFVPGFILEAASMQEQAVAEASEHTAEANRI